MPTVFILLQWASSQHFHCVTEASFSGCWGRVRGSTMIAKNVGQLEKLKTAVSKLYCRPLVLGKTLQNSIISILIVRDVFSMLQSYL